MAAWERQRIIDTVKAFYETIGIDYEDYVEGDDAE
jgi:hypothetical protein